MLGRRSWGRWAQWKTEARTTSHGRHGASRLPHPVELAPAVLGPLATCSAGSALRRAATDVIAPLAPVHPDAQQWWGVTLPTTERVRPRGSGPRPPPHPWSHGQPEPQRA
ncbi:hypothetical protein PR202_ga08029 [Eleusine coracana subsp. coracana]|uniref:Uncharacterized protein n=1 Tax=Eleusine coracana subsp. coracana TaxID=191504 RepID=A0AAV5BZ31_ELECO|nr:hypothetical protein PR202_ga08029 [Eleusine coracana subsp. coracana]